MKILKILKVMIFEVPGSQKTVLKLRRVAPALNLQITCRGEDSLSDSNTPPGRNQKTDNVDIPALPIK